MKRSKKLQRVVCMLLSFVIMLSSAAFGGYVSADTAEDTTTETESLDVVYVKQGEDGNGKSPASPVGTITTAYQLLGNDGGTMVICGEFVLQGAFTEPAHDGKIIITQKYNGIDYSEQGAFSTGGIQRRYDLNGPTVFENIDISTTNGAGLAIVAQYNYVELGEGVECSGFGGTQVSDSLAIIGGINDTSVQQVERTTDSHIVVRSGSGILIVGMNRMVKEDHERSAYIEVYGGTVSTVYGGNINGNYGGSVYMDIYGGSFTRTFNIGYGVSGEIRLEILGGEFASSLSIIGKSANSKATLAYAAYKDTLAATLSSKFTGFNSAYQTYDVVYVQQGSTGNGTTAETPIGSITDAYTKLGTDGGKIVIMGAFTMSGPFTPPVHEGKVTITQKHDGVDYSNGESFYTGADAGRRISLNGPTVFEHINLKTDSGKYLMISCQYNYFELGEGVVCTGFTGTAVANSLAIIGGYSDSIVTASVMREGDAHIVVRSGSGILLVGLNRNYKVDHDKNATIDVYGGTVVTVYGGNINGNYGGSVHMNVYGGTFTNTFDIGYGVAGRTAVQIEGGSFASGLALKAKTSTSKTVHATLSYDASMAQVMSGVTYTGFNYAGVDHDVVFVQQGATGDGTSAQTPVGTITTAYNMLGNNGGTLVICGAFAMQGSFTEPPHDGEITITQNYNDLDYRAGGAFSNGGVSRKYVLSGPVVFENINFEATDGTGLVVVCQYHPLVVGEGVGCSGFNATQVIDSFSIIGGISDSAGSFVNETDDACITVKSGSGILIAGLNRFVDTVHRRNTNIEIYGGQFHKIYGGNINGGTGGNVSMKIYGGTFKVPISSAYGITGCVSLEIYGGNFDNCSTLGANIALDCVATLGTDAQAAVMPKLTGFHTILTSEGKVNVKIPEDVFEYASFTSSMGTTLPYRVYYPEGYETSNEQYPIFVYFHGLGSRGTDNKLQLGANHALVTKVLNSGTDCVIVAPQCPTSSAWVRTYPGDTAFDPTVIPESEHLMAAMELINEMLSDSNIDRHRLYLGGGSNGGAACWSIISRNPTSVAAAIIQAGTGSSDAPEVVAEACLDTPIWTFHGDVDSTLSVEGTRAIADSIASMGGEKLIYTEMPGYDHNIWTDSANTPGLLEWLFDGYRARMGGDLLPSYAEREDLAGDVDGDGLVNNSDVTVIVRYLSGFDAIDDTSYADVTADGKINNRDAIALIVAIAESESEYG